MGAELRNPAGVKTPAAAAVVALAGLAGWIATRGTGASEELLAPDAAAPVRAGAEPAPATPPPVEPSRAVATSDEAALELEQQGESGALTTEADAVPPALAFFGRAVDGESGAPIAGVELFRAAPASPAPSFRAFPRSTPQAEDLAAAREARSDATGLFELRCAPRGPVRGLGTGDPSDPWERVGAFGLRAPGRACAYFVPGGGHASAATARAIPMWRAATLVLRARGFGEARPLRFELVAPAAADGAPADGRPAIARRSHEAALDALGEGECGGLPPKVPLELALVFEDGRRLAIAEGLTLAPGERRVLEWDLAGGATVVGRALDQDGQPAAELELVLARDGPADRTATLRYRRKVDADVVWARATTDAAGRFEIEGVPPGRWWLGPDALPDGSRPPPEAKRAELCAPVAHAIDVPEARAHLEVELDLWRGLYLTGRVEEEATGAACGDWTILSSAEGIVGLKTTRTDRDGRFVLGPLPRSPHELTAYDLHGPAIAARAPTVPHELVLRVPARGAIAGVIGGAPPERILVDLAGPGETGVVFQFTAVDGRFSKSELQPGEYTALVRTEDGRAAARHDLVVRSGETTHVRLELSPAARLVLHHAGPRATRVELRHGNRTISYETLHPGIDRATTVPPGTIAVRPLDGPERTIELAAGEVGRLELGSE